MQNSLKTSQIMLSSPSLSSATYVLLMSTQTGN